MCTWCHNEPTPLPRHWVCKSGCVCWTLRPALSRLDHCAWAVALRSNVHMCTRKAIRGVLDVTWDLLVTAVSDALTQGLASARDIACCLSEMHDRPWTYGKCTLLGMVLDNEDRAIWLLNQGCCPNLHGCLLIYGRPCDLRWLFGDNQHGDAVQRIRRKAGGLKDTEVNTLTPHLRVPQRWYRYHSRPHRTAWLSLVARRQVIRAAVRVSAKLVRT